MDIHTSGFPTSSIDGQGRGLDVCVLKSPHTVWGIRSALGCKLQSTCKGVVCKKATNYLT